MKKHTKDKKMTDNELLQKAKEAIKFLDSLPGDIKEIIGDSFYYDGLECASGTVAELADEVADLGGAREGLEVITILPLSPFKISVKEDGSYEVENETE